MPGRGDPSEPSRGCCDGRAGEDDAAPALDTQPDGQTFRPSTPWRNVRGTGHPRPPAAATRASLLAAVTRPHPCPGRSRALTALRVPWVKNLAAPFPPPPNCTEKRSKDVP